MKILIKHRGKTIGSIMTNRTTIRPEEICRLAGVPIAWADGDYEDGKPIKGMYDLSELRFITERESA